MEQLNYNLLFRWFLGLSPDDSIWHPTRFTKNRDRLLNEAMIGRFLEKLMDSAELKSLLSDKHFSVDGTLLQAWASHASLERIDGQDDPPPSPSKPGEGFATPKSEKKRAKGDLRGIRLSNDTHRSSSDPNIRLCRKSKAHPALPSYRGHILMDNRNDLVMNCRVTLADGYGKREAAKEMAADLTGVHQKTISADKRYDTDRFVKETWRLGMTPHVVQNINCPGRSAIDRHTTHHKGYAKSIHSRRGIEKVFGWIKQFSCLRQVPWLRQGAGRVWPPHDCLQPDLPEQST